MFIPIPHLAVPNYNLKIRVTLSTPVTLSSSNISSCKYSRRFVVEESLRESDN